MGCGNGSCEFSHLQCPKKSDKMPSKKCIIRQMRRLRGSQPDAQCILLVPLRPGGPELTGAPLSNPPSTQGVQMIFQGHMPSRPRQDGTSAHGRSRTTSTRRPEIGVRALQAGRRSFPHVCLRPTLPF
jgi:hypothetical protein